MLSAAAKEFADAEAMIRSAEKLFGPYRWDRYDILVVPPNFPFGGAGEPAPFVHLADGHRRGQKSGFGDRA